MNAKSAAPYVARFACHRPFLLLAAGAALTACTGDDGPAGPPGPAGGTTLDTELEPGEDAPGVNLEILSIEGGSGAGGAFQVGDRVAVTFTARMDDGTDWDLSSFSTARVLVSGPTFNYQRVLAEQRDVGTASTANGDGSYTYTFTTPLPATYLEPLNDSPSFDRDDGELAGQALLSGTYTVGMYLAWMYTVQNETGSFRDVGNATADFLFGSAQMLAPRELVKLDNCNQCHSDLQAHGGQRRDPTLCLLCHTAGSEDRNNPMAAGGTPGASIDFSVMIHKIHNGAHLPSVLGIGVRSDGTRDYTKTPQPYELVGFNDSAIDFSEVAFPVWPSLTAAMPRDEGYSALGSTERALEDAQRSGVVSCNVCHGDPDGTGPLTAPAQGEIAYQQPSRSACGSCHDDIDWLLPYRSNSQTMPFQATDSACTQCHGQMGSALAVEDAHRHPLIDPGFNPGLQFDLMRVTEAGTNDGDGTFDPGEKVALTFTLTDDGGADVDPADVDSISAVMSGPTSNMQLLVSSSVATGKLTGGQPYTINLPRQVFLEHAGTSTAALDRFMTALAPHYDAAGAATTVWARTATGGGSALAMDDLPAPRNYVDVTNPAGFARDDYVVIDDGTANEEYVRIQFVEGDRLWFGSAAQTDYAPGTVFDHLAGATVREVTLTALAEGVDYVLDDATGTIEERVEQGVGTDVVATYTTDFVVPDRYPLAQNDSPDLADDAGEWVGKSLVDGTYRVAIWGYRDLTLDLFGESNGYRAPSEAAHADVLVGGASEVEPYDLIASADTCYSCHQDIYFHGNGRRGFDSCIMCHGASGSEDRPQYRAANAPPTTALEIRFRSMLHSIHMGAELANASTYTVVGFGSGYPNNFSEHTYEHVEFPSFPSGTKNCVACHGAGNEAWMMPTTPEHPSDPGMPAQPWSLACGACHDGDAAQAHIAAQTAPNGAESCAICHEAGSELAIEVVHKVR